MNELELLKPATGRTMTHRQIADVGRWPAEVRSADVGRWPAEVRSAEWSGAGLAGVRNREVRAWQAGSEAWIPIWIVRNFHDLHGDRRLTHKSGHEVGEHDWIVDMGDGLATVLSPVEFEAAFEKLVP